jgi:hypothetical protein
MGCKHTTILAPLLLLLGALPLYSQAAAEVLPAAPSFAAPSSASPSPANFRDRMHWVVRNTVGEESLVAGLATAGFGTAQDHPAEYGTHFDGFAQRYAIRMSGVATSNLMEAGLGSLWGEDPKYYRLGATYSFKARLKQVALETFYSRKRGGGFTPAYARLIAVPSSNFLSNTWRADSEADTSHALLRTVYGFAGHMTRNAWEEFRPGKKF